MLGPDMNGCWARPKLYGGGVGVGPGIRGKFAISSSHRSPSVLTCTRRASSVPNWSSRFLLVTSQPGVTEYPVQTWSRTLRDSSIPPWPEATEFPPFQCITAEFTPSKPGACELPPSWPKHAEFPPSQLGADELPQTSGSWSLV